MSLRQSVNRSRIERFLKELGERYHRHGRLYLVGGTTLVFEAYRQQTLEIDIVIEVAPEDHSAFIQIVRELKETLDVNVEEASPGDFIPLPGGYADRHEFIARFGQLYVFHFDLYSTALSKIERGRSQDLADVILLLQAQRIEWEQLEKFFQEILPRVGTQSLKQDPVEFEKNFRALEGMWRKAQRL
jgi:hypothetical protein